MDLPSSYRRSAAGTLNQFGGPFRRQGLFASFVGAALLGQGDTLIRMLPVWLGCALDRQQLCGGCSSTLLRS